MREIIFRVWDSKVKRFCKNPSMLRLNLGTGDVHGCRSAGNVHEWQLEQYTGLKDKNGVDIYEGDLVFTNEYSRADGTDPSYFQIAFREGCFLGIDKNGNERFADRISKGKVVGNIHENPELLSDKEGE